MTRYRGHKVPLSPLRRFVCDLLHASADIPTVGLERRLRLAPLVEAREAAAPRPSWCAIFAKAYACVAAARPELRRIYMRYPWPHLYEHPISVTSVAVEREVDGEAGLFFAHLRAPDTQGLTKLDTALKRLKEAPVADVSMYRRILRVSRLPRPLRRLLWCAAVHLSGRRRARLFGTFGISPLGGMGCSTMSMYSPLTTTLTYGPIEPDGSVVVRVMLDHRALDGGPVARALDHLERVLNGQIVAELGYLRSPEAPFLAA